VLGSGLGLLNQAEEVPLALMETLLDGLNGVLRELLILHDKVMEVVSEVVSACRATMAIKNSKKANLRPLDVQISLVLWLEDIQNDGNSILIVVSDDSLVGIGRIRLNDATLLLRGLRWLVILQLDGLGVERRGVLSEEKSLNFHELNICIFALLRGQRCWNVHSVAIVILLRVG
jgi:hypothetical protein